MRERLKERAREREKEPDPQPGGEGKRGVGERIWRENESEKGREDK